MSHAIQRRLEALQHPTPDKLDYNDRKVFASTIVWLEDQKIRIYRIEDRAGLRRLDDMSQWEEAYSEYRKAIGMPSLQNAKEELAWLLDAAIRLEFIDNTDRYGHINAAQVKVDQTAAVVPTIKSESFFDDLDYNHKDFVAGVRSMTKKLRIPVHPDHLLQLEAVTRLIRERISPALAGQLQPITGKPFPFDQGNQAVSLHGDAALEQPGRILRLLQIQSIRQLQTRINETIVAVQELTANPKTDTKLGKVGR